jgi:hypothetical protein
MAQTLYKMRKVSQIQRFEGVEAWQEGFSSKSVLHGLDLVQLLWRWCCPSVSFWRELA